MSVVKDVIGSITGANAADAARGQGQAALQAGEIAAEQGQLGIDEINKQFGLTESAFAPTIASGQGAFDQQAALSGALGPEAQKAAFANFQASPGQQFLQQQGEKALLRNAAATGQLGGGRTQQALQEQAIGLAQQDFANQFSRLGNVAGQGLTLQSQLGGLRQGLGTNIANLRGGIGQAQGDALLGNAQAGVNAAAAQDQGVANIIGLGAMAFSDSRLKTDVRPVGEFGGMKFYNWQWNERGEALGKTGRAFGVIAQELEETHPHLIIDADYKIVKEEQLFAELESFNG
jgi:hypothetical protein